MAVVDPFRQRVLDSIIPLVKGKKNTPELRRKLADVVDQIHKAMQEHLAAGLRGDFRTDRQARIQHTANLYIKARHGMNIEEMKEAIGKLLDERDQLEKDLRTKRRMIADLERARDRPLCTIAWQRTKDAAKGRLESALGRLM